MLGVDVGEPVAWLRDAAVYACTSDVNRHSRIRSPLTAF